MSLSLTDVRELDRLILMDLDDLSLSQACQVNQWLQQICSDDLFWRERLQRRFGHEIMLMKKPRETYHQMYIRLAQLEYDEDQVGRSAEEGHLDEILLLYEAGVPMKWQDFIQAAIEGHLAVIEWALNTLEPEPDGGYRWVAEPERFMRAAVYGNQLKLAQWLNRNYDDLITPEVKIYALDRAGPELLDWLEQQGYVPGARDIGTAFFASNTEAMDWLIRRGIWPRLDDYIFALTTGRIGPLEHMYQQYEQLPDLRQVDINHAALNGKLASLIWLEEHGYPYPDAQTAQRIAENIRGWHGGSKDMMDTILSFKLVLDWLSQRGIRANTWTTLMNYLGL